MEKLFHLKNDLGINKAAIKRAIYEYRNDLYEDEFKERGFDIVKELVDRRTVSYNAEEAKLLVENYLTSHDLCVIDNTGNGEFSAVEEYQANKKYDRMALALLRIETIK